MDDHAPHPATHLTPDPSAAAETGLAVGEGGRAGWRALVIDLTPLRVSRDFRLLFAGQSVTLFGSMMTFVALPMQMFQLTQSSFAVGMLSVAEFVPMISMAFVGGALADYVDRRRMVRATEALLAGGTLVLILNSLLARPHVWVLFACAGLFAGLNGLQRPSLEAMVPRVVPPELIASAAALRALSGSVGTIGGPALGGLLVATLGPTLTYSIDFSTFLVSLIALWMMRAVPPPLDADRPSLKSIANGLRYALKRQELLGTYLVDINAMFFAMPMALFPAMAHRFGGASAGLLYSAPAVGALAVTLTSGWTTRVHRHGLAVAVAAATWGVAIIAFGLAPTLPLALACLVAAGGADMVSGLFRMTIWNQTIPDHLRGRLAGIEMVSYMSGPLLGNARAGAVASLAGVRASIVSGGLLCIVGAAALTLLLPDFLHYDGRDGPARKQAEEEARLAARDIERGE
jgi:MFS family permease